MNDTGFRIIAIKTGEKQNTYPKDRTGVRLDFLKVLKSNTIYSFYDYYKFPKNDFTEIGYYQKEYLGLYELSSHPNTAININAIVGSNGSGKSTLVELLFWANYNIGCKLELFEDDYDHTTYDFIDLEIFYSLDKYSFYKLGFKKGEIKKQNFKFSGSLIEQDGIEVSIQNVNDLTNYFYSIFISYSHYALNELEVGEWINPLFHKNDGYQTPLVLNPVRNKGILDINKEKYLLKRRLQANILETIELGKEEDSLRNLANGKIAKELDLVFNLKEFPDLMEPKDQKLIGEIKEALDKLFGVNISQEEHDFNFFVNITLNYIFEKLLKISILYKPYYKYQDGKLIKDVNNFLGAIKGSNSHITFKIKGAILYLKYFKEIFNKSSIQLDERITLSIEKLSHRIKAIGKQEDFIVNTFMMAPPSYFNPDIILDNNIPFDTLSSGEKQRIHSISSIAYHLINLNSVEAFKLKEGGYISYNYINIILDEIELYYHPEWQRMFITHLLDYIGKINPNNLEHIKGLNITFLTHSPYILSDLPLSNILRLEEGGVSKFNRKEETFGANIYSLLSNDFLMKDGIMGEWARNKINNTITLLKDKKPISDPDSVRTFISLIGEPIIRTKLMEMLAENLGENAEVARLQEQQEFIAKRLKELKNDSD